MLFFLQIKFLFLLCQKNTKTLFHFTTGVKNHKVTKHFAENLTESESRLNLHKNSLSLFIYIVH